MKVIEMPIVPLLKLVIVATTFFSVSEVLATDRPQVIVKATDYMAASDGVSKANGYVAIAPGENWISLDVKIPETGRYRVDVASKAAADDSVTLYVEDYIENTDGRNYNITAAMVPPAEEAFQIVGKDGSPLKAGQHRMKLHADGGASSIQSITFTSIKPHELTPYTLKQNLVGKDWVLVWSDEFESEGLPDPKIWAYDIGNWGWGNHEPQYYTAERLENARCEDGRLIVEARKDRKNGGWSSARLTTRGPMSLLYGRIELSGRVAEWQSGRVAEWQSGRVAEWQSGRVAEWLHGMELGPPSGCWETIFETNSHGPIVGKSIFLKT